MVDIVLAVLGLLRQSEFRFDRNSECQSTLLALRHGVLGFLDVVFEKFKEEVFSGVGNREVHLEHRLETLVLPA